MNYQNVIQMSPKPSFIVWKTGMLSVIWGNIGAQWTIFPSIPGCATLSFSDAMQYHFLGRAFVWKDSGIIGLTRKCSFNRAGVGEGKGNHWLLYFNIDFIKICFYCWQCYICLLSPPLSPAPTHPPLGFHHPIAHVHGLYISITLICK